MYFAEEGERRQIAMERKGERSNFRYFSVFILYTIPILLCSPFLHLFRCRVIFGMAGS